MIDENNIAVLGAGSWGTAIVKMLSENTSKILWYVRDSKQVDQIIKTRSNPKYLKNLELNIEKLLVSDDLDFIIKNLKSLF